MTGHHKNIETWRRHKSLERTLDKRPDMLKHAPLTKEDLAVIWRNTKTKNREVKRKCWVAAINGGAIVLAIAFGAFAQTGN